MIPTAVDDYLPPSMLIDLKRIISSYRTHGAKIRMIGVWYEDFAQLMADVSKHIHYPFSPTVLGVPVQPTSAQEVSVIAVQDDDTNITKDLHNHEVLEWQP